MRKDSDRTSLSEKVLVALEGTTILATIVAALLALYSHEDAVTSRNETIEDPSPKTVIEGFRPRSTPSNFVFTNPQVETRVVAPERAPTPPTPVATQAK